MMMITLIKTKLNSTIHLLTFIYAILYIIFIGRSIVICQYFMNIEGITVYLLFLLFLTAFVLSWYIEFISGILLLIWNLGIWITGFFFDSYNHLTGIISGIPLIVLVTIEFVYFKLRNLEFAASVVFIIGYFLLRHGYDKMRRNKL